MTEKIIMGLFGLATFILCLCSVVSTIREKRNEQELTDILLDVVGAIFIGMFGLSVFLFNLVSIIGGTY